MTSPKKGGGGAVHDGPGKVNEELGFLPWIAVSWWILSHQNPWTLRMLRMFILRLHLAGSGLTGL